MGYLLPFAHRHECEYKEERLRPARKKFGFKRKELKFQRKSRTESHRRPDSERTFRACSVLLMRSTLFSSVVLHAKYIAPLLTQS